MQKIQTVLRRDPDDMSRVLPEVTPGCEWVLAGEGVSTRKYDGTCTMLSADGRWWARREVKPGKELPPGYEAVDTDPVTRKIVGWEPIDQSPFVKAFRDALDERAQVVETVPGLAGRAVVWQAGTYELCGPKVNGNPERFERHQLVRHADAEVIDMAEDLEAGGLPWTVDEVMHVVRWAGERGWEGVVWHHPDGRMAKLKVRDLRHV